MVTMIAILLQFTATHKVHMSKMTVNDALNWGDAASMHVSTSVRTSLWKDRIMLCVIVT